MSDHRLAALVEGFRGLPVAVIGDAMLDGYLEGTAERMCREAPVPVVRVSTESYSPGGGANMAANLAAMGAHVRFISVVGDDADGGMLLSRLEDAGVDCGDVLRDAARTTVAKRRLVADGQLAARFDAGSESPIGAGAGRALLEALDAYLESAAALVISDYRCGVLSDAVIAALSLRRRLVRGPLVVDSTHLAAYRQLRPDIVKPSLAEALGQLSLSPSRPDSRTDLAEALGDALLDLTGACVVALTLDEDGAVVFEAGQPPLHTPAHFRGHAHPAGAGDTYLAGFTLAVAAGAGTGEAAEIAASAAAVVVEAPGTSLCPLPQLKTALRADSHKVRTLDEAAEEVERRRKAGQSVVFTNGCFDILHPGHIALLEQARSLGDVLILGVNGDESVRELKGDGRPVNRLEDRLRVLSALSFVDLLVAFDERTAVPLIEALRPDVYVKGGDYRVPEIPEAGAVEACGGRIEILPYFGTQSTSEIIARIRDSSVVRVS